MLDEKLLVTLQALIDTIIPPDDYPGGWEAGVGNYLLKQFEGDLKDKLPMYQAGLLALDTEALTVYKKPFAEISSPEQVELLTHIEQGKLQSEWSIDAADFFTMAVKHCAEGFYGDPGNGGNKEGIAWKMIGYEVTA